ncbi:hypothetical protein OJAV_G00071030 [Oryzias javanicus]|uniref:Uncharacterized protein n=1 Tax=Oryzias javanicus TaxID=123683 RepID=A0A3S2Q5W9_ORYJA|nr:hypothetical protein OJAV_G00071030 [Oryzias javanicus]
MLTSAQSFFHEGAPLVILNITPLLPPALISQHPTLLTISLFPLFIFSLHSRLLDLIREERNEQQRMVKTKMEKTFPNRRYKEIRDTPVIEDF